VNASGTAWRTTARRTGQARMRASIDEGSGTCKRFNAARHDGRHHQRRRGGAVRRHVPPRLEGGASTRAGKCSSSPWWPQAVVHALVKCGGAARRQGGRRRRRRRDVEEVEEVGEVGVLGDSGSGSSHGRLRSSRWTVLPRTAPIPPSPPITSLLLRWVGGRTGERFPPRRLGLGAL
jgi:hypothetical protein